MACGGCGVRTNGGVVPNTFGPPAYNTGGMATVITGNPPLTTCRDRFWIGFALGVIAWVLVQSQR